MLNKKVESNFDEMVRGKSTLLEKCAAIITLHTGRYARQQIAEKNTYK